MGARARSKKEVRVGNTIGTLFRATTFGESHGAGLGVVVDGCPPLIPLTAALVQAELDRRRPGQSRLTSTRAEADRVEILSGCLDGRTLGTPIAMLVRNVDARPADYREIAAAYRPSHADYTTEAKYGIRAAAGGGRASARETVGRVAAAAVARELLRVRAGVEIVAYVRRVQRIVAGDVDPERVTRADVDSNPVRCPDGAAARRMIRLIERVRKAGDSLGGVVECVARGVPVGLGEPVFDKLDADLAKALLSLPASKGFEIGSGFGGTLLLGSQHNDAFYMEGGRVRTRTNRSGGLQGGISNGESILVRVAFKPTATIARAQSTVNRQGKAIELKGRGRHDPCVLPRAVPMVEAMVALVLADHYLRQLAIAPPARRSVRKVARAKQR
jgi:chorismate synthase